MNHVDVGIKSEIACSDAPMPTAKRNQGNSRWRRYIEMRFFGSGIPESETEPSALYCGVGAENAAAILPIVISISPNRFSAWISDMRNNASIFSDYG